MKTAICLVLFLGCALAKPSSPLKLDWSKITPKTAYVDPINDITFPSERVVGGTEATRNSFPYQVALFIQGTSFCGGSLISTGYVLTAAHCTNGAAFVQVVLGAHNVRETESTQVIVTSTSLIIHSGYVSSTLTNDASLIRLPSPVTLNNYIRTISLAPANSGSFAGSNAVLSGWGRVSDSSNAISPTLQRVSLSVITNAVCANTFGTNIIRDSTICTSGQGTVGACNGDSGGPLTVNGVQVGITSFISSRGCNSGLPSGYGRVSSFRTWISQNSGV